MKVQTAGSSLVDRTWFPLLTSIDIQLRILTNSLRYNVPALEQNIAVGVALVPVLVVDPLRKYLVTFRNASPGAQNIRVGGAPSFAAGAESGQLLAPNNTLVLEGIGVNINAIADLAGGLLSVLCYSTIPLV